MPPAHREAALRLIILEKFLKGTLVLVAAVVFTVLLATGSTGSLHGVATHLRHHVTAAWSIFVADEIVSVTEERHLIVATAAMFLDASVTLVEWYALRQGHAWGEWLVVVATSSLLPFEVVALVRHGHLGRFAVLAVNVAIVLYLIHHVRKHARARATIAALSQ
jgi:uncharacterized membrane protein (DUF2068 family)